MVLDHTPFYAESGGQIGDAGMLTVTAATGAARVRPRVHRARHAENRRLVCACRRARTSGELRVGDAVEAQVDDERRTAIALNHSATHLLHAALREVLGKHVEQKGSLVAADRLRFDFSHTQAVSQEELRQIEDLVNSAIRRNAPAETRVMALDEAVAAGAMSLFGEKYESDVRVLSIGDFSMELCGGTHVERAGDIGLFKILSESGVAAGVRRVEAVTGKRRMSGSCTPIRCCATLRRCFEAAARTWTRKSANSSSARGGWKRRFSSSNPNSPAARAAICHHRQKT